MLSSTNAWANAIAFLIFCVVCAAIISVIDGELGPETFQEAVIYTSAGKLMWMDFRND